MTITSRMTRAVVLAALVSASAPGQTSPVKAQSAAPLTAIANSVCRPTFKVDAVAYEAGTAFLVSSARPLLLTAQHLFGPEGGLAKAVTWQNMPAHAHLVSCKPIGSGRPISGQAAVPVPGAHPMVPDDQSGSINDVAVFRTSSESGATPSLALAVSPPRKGDRVFLIAEAQGSDSPVHPAHVLGLRNGALLFAYDDPKLELQATSGAPIVNVDGKVVGLNLGGGYDDEAKIVVGVADNLEVVTKAVAAASAP